MEGYSFEKLTFLIADDNAHMRKLLVTILRALGAVTILEAENGERGWQVFCSNHIDIVITDWQMEVANGIELVNRIRNSPASPDVFVPIIMLTGHAQADHVRIARDSGANEFITKPVSVKGLLAKLVSLVENPRPFVRTKTYFGPCRRRHDVPFPGPDRRKTDPPSSPTFVIPPPLPAAMPPLTRVPVKEPEK